jgi:hypothetical protein
VSSKTLAIIANHNRRAAEQALTSAMSRLQQQAQRELSALELYGVDSGAMLRAVAGPCFDSTATAPNAYDQGLRARALIADEIEALLTTRLLRRLEQDEQLARLEQDEPKQA